jgi:hypothetical protein
MYNYMDDTITISSSTNYSSVHNKHIYNSDKGFHIIKRKKTPRGHFSLEFYETPNVSDCRMRNAITGAWYRDDHPKCKYLVGTRQEDLFFKVRISTGRNLVSEYQPGKVAMLRICLIKSDLIGVCVQIISSKVIQ